MKRESYYQSNAVNPEFENEEEKLEDVEKRAAVLAVLESPGYMEFHKIMNEVIEMATIEACSVKNSFDRIRYYQGMLDGVRIVRYRFIDMSKEKKNGR